MNKSSECWEISSYLLRNHSLSVHATVSEKLTCLTPLYAQVQVCTLK